MDLRSKPRVFVSSTISDFADIRSALKYWLEEMGFEARMSEYVDFERHPEDGTFDSCFNAIADCTYYILLIGGRKGSDFSNGVSVTQQEYRVAADLAKRGHLKPILFIRKEVMTALSERKTLEENIGSSAVVDETPSKVLQDPEFVRDFVEEIQATAYEREGREGRAGAFWYYQFETFHDIIDALKVNLQLNHPVEAQRLLANLRWELAMNLKELYYNTDKHSGFMYDLIASLRGSKRLRQKEPDSKVVVLNNDQFVGIYWFVANAYLRVPHLQTTALQAALQSGQFLSYHLGTEGPTPGPLHEIMYLLKLSIWRCQRLVDFYTKEGDYYTVLLRGSGLFRRLVQRLSDSMADSIVVTYNAVKHKRLRQWLRLAQTIQPTIRTNTLTLTLRASDEMENVVMLSMALLRYIESDTDDLHMPRLNPPVPYHLERERLFRSDPQRLDVDEWISFLIQLGDRPLA